MAVSAPSRQLAMSLLNSTTFGALWSYALAPLAGSAGASAGEAARSPPSIYSYLSDSSLVKYLSEYQLNPFSAARSYGLRDRFIEVRLRNRLFFDFVSGLELGDGAKAFLFESEGRAHELAAWAVGGGGAVARALYQELLGIGIYLPLVAVPAALTLSGEICRGDLQRNYDKYIFALAAAVVALLALVAISHALGFKISDSRLKIEAKYRSTLRKCEADVLAVMRRVDCQPLLLRLAWSEAATFDSSVRKWPDCGGCVGYIRHDSELNHPNNSGLRKAVLILRDVKKKHSLISWADLIQMAGALAVESTGGPRIDMVYGRVDCPIDAPIASHSSYNTVRKSHDKKSGTGKIVAALLDSSKLSQDPQSLIKQNNKAAIDSGCLAARLPTPTQPFPDGAASADAHVRNVFYRMGLTARDTVALMGAHTIGRAFKDRSGTCPFATGDNNATAYTAATCLVKPDPLEPFTGMAGGCSWTRNWLTFDNSYYLLGLQYNSHSKDSYHLPSRGDAAVLNSSILSSARKDKRPTTATRRDAAAGDAAAGRGSRSNSTDEGATTSLAPFFHVSGKPGDLMWLPTDEALKESPEFYKYFTRYAADKEAFFADYSLAHKKMSELGCRYVTGRPLVMAESRGDE